MKNTGRRSAMVERADASGTTRTSGEVYSHDGQEDLTAYPMRSRTFARSKRGL